MDKIIKLLKAALLVIVTVALCNIFYDYGKGYYNIYQEEYKGVTSTVGEDVVVEIPSGAAAKTIAGILKDKGLIQFEGAFVKRLQESDYRIKEGVYTLNTGMSTLDMIKTMSPVIEVEEKIDTLVIPEGFTVEQIAVRCEKQGICSAQDFLNEVNSVTTEDFPYLADVPAGANVKYKLQGYLFPATYDIYESTTAKSLVKWMLETFDNYYTLDLQARADELGYNSYELVTRASIIERECKVEEERARIAGVINNRLSADMPLQMCPTVLYPLTDGLYDQARVYYEDLELDSPYNTYKYSGLPVGPICNPGIACINAVLYPESHNYYYYHVINEEEGTHIFTETYEEHVNTQIIGGPNGISESDLDENGNYIGNGLPTTESTETDYEDYFDDLDE